MTNSQLTKPAKLRRLSRKLGAKKTDDKDGVLATLQIARRLIQDEGYAASEALNLAADKYAAPIDKSRAFWAAHYALTRAARDEWPILDLLDAAGVDVLLPILDAAIKHQGEMNMKAKKAK